eukprot:gene12374-biopygen563
MTVDGSGVAGVAAHGVSGVHVMQTLDRTFVHMKLLVSITRGGEVPEGAPLQLPSAAQTVCVMLPPSPQLKAVDPVPPVCAQPVAVAIVA